VRVPRSGPSAPSPTLMRPPPPLRLPGLMQGINRVLYSRRNSAQFGRLLGSGPATIPAQRASLRQASALSARSLSGDASPGGSGDPGAWTESCHSSPSLAQPCRGRIPRALQG